MSVPVFIDVLCPKCRRRFGWQGRMVDRPPCPRCGHQAPKVDLEAADARMDADRALIASRPEASIVGRQRVIAGLTLRQAAKLLGLTPSELSDLENGRHALTPELVDKMAAIYGVGEGEES
jgi:ribosome-binding protein aMBF1 (putative translation factor)